MFDAYLVAPKTVVTAKGESPALDISPAVSRTMMFLLDISNVVEQEALEVHVQASSDGETWSARSLVTYPQKFYRGSHPLLVDLSNAPEIKFVKARWETTRWGRGSETPMFEFSVRVTEVPAETLRAMAQK